MRIAIAGGGIFGLTAAVELAERGHAITVIDPGPIPHPLAESTDISKVVRLDYGSDADYVALGEQALAGWRRWNTEQRLFHETGVTFLSRAPMQPGGFEHDSYELLRSRGHELERLRTDDIAKRFPAYRRGVYVDGYCNPVGGWAEASAAVGFLAARAISMGVELRAARATRIEVDGLVVTHTNDAEEKRIDADLVLICAGAWVPRLLPELAGALHAIGQPVFHLKPEDPSLFAAHHFPVFGADISRTGYYGFPANRDGIVKIANHGTGIAIADDHERVTTAAQEAALRDFLADSFPALANAPITHRRLCVYCDTADAHFWIAAHPDRPNIVVATGGSGHAFKFAPALGPLIADIATGVAHPLTHKFRWRVASRSRGDAARHT
jgi:glycine/D-amino acid oxidase-like deaminating enzyme